MFGKISKFPVFSLTGILVFAISPVFPVQWVPCSVIGKTWIFKQRQTGPDLYAVSIAADKRWLHDADVHAHRHVLVYVLRGPDAARGPAHVVLVVRRRRQRAPRPQHREGHVALQDVKVPRDDAPLLWDLD